MIPHVDAIEALTTRVSAGPLIEPPPSDAVLQQILAAAARAPDHGRLRPWRFALVRGAARARFGELMARTLRARQPDVLEAQLQRERSKPLRAPLILVIGAKVDPSAKIPVIEQILSAGAAAQNAMVAAHALGYGCAWKTGDAAYDPQVKAAFGLEAKDAIVAFLYLGTNAKPLPAAAPADLGALVSEWTGV